MTAAPDLRASVTSAFLATSTSTQPLDLPDAIGAEDLRSALHTLMPDARRRQKRLGIPEDVTEETLSDIDRKIDVYRRGADVRWMIGILRGDVIALGRLQFERVPEDGTHAIHLPEGDRLSADLVDDSLDRATALLGTSRFRCTSWILDPLIAVLPLRSNLRRFRARFRIDDAPRTSRASDEAARFVFQSTAREARIARRLPSVTSVERLVGTCLRSGGDWSEPTGFLTHPE